MLGNNSIIVFTNKRTTALHCTIVNIILDSTNENAIMGLSLRHKQF